MRILIQSQGLGPFAGAVGVIADPGVVEDPWAVIMGGNPLGGVIAAPAGAARVVLGSGFIPMEDEELGVVDPRTWGQEGWDRLRGAIEEYMGRFAGEVLVRPRARGVLSDAPSCLRFLEWSATQARRPGLLLDPVGMLTGDMVARAEDHVGRLLGMVAGRPGIAGVVVSNVTEEHGEAVRAALHRGVIDGGTLVAMVREHVPEGVPLVIGGEAIDEQVAMLRGGA